MAEFDTWRAFANFEREVSRDRRYVRAQTAERFLLAVRNSCESRRSHISKGRGLWRAQAGHGWRHIPEIDDEIPAAFPKERMKPLEDRAMEGRSNPKGIPVLYLCSNKEAAMSEVRPWIGSLISLGHFEITRNLTVVDCTRDHEKTGLFYFEEHPEEEWDLAVWAQIDSAFTKPVTRSDDRDEYVATQILSELFRDEGFDGIAYKSAFGERSTNFALFDRESAELRSCQLFEVTQAKLNFRERDNPYWVRSAKASKSKKQRARRS